MLKIEFGALTDVGRKRSQNEDSYLADPELRLFVVADGMGGHASGEVASKAVTETVRAFIVQTAEDRHKTWPFAFDPQLPFEANQFRAAVSLANEEVARRVADEEALRGMGATTSGVLLTDTEAVIANVGDCRTYLIRQGSIRQLTLDHSWVAEQVRNGLIAPADARQHPWRNRVTRAVAGREGLDVDIVVEPLASGDRLLICSDGLHGPVPDDEILKYVMAAATPQAACEALIDAANAAGGPDNVTAIVLAVAD